VTPGRIKRVCEVCGAEFEMFRAHVRRRGGRFCSKECKSASQRRGVIRSANDSLRAAHQAGYRALGDGTVVDPSGHPVKVNSHRVTKYLSFSVKGCASPIAVHRFVAFQLFGESAIEAECVRHLNGDRHDNSFANIAYGTHSDNQLGIPEPQRRSMGMKRNRGRRRFTPAVVREIRARLTAGASLKSLRRMYGGGYGTFANIRDGITYQDVT